MAYNGLRGNAIKIADRINTSIAGGNKIVILDSQTLDDLIGLQVAELQAETLKNQLCAFKPQPPGPGGSQAPTGGGGTSILGDVSSIISSTASLVQALTPDSTSNDSDITITDGFLISEEIAAIQRKHSDIEVIWPKRDLQLPSFDIANAPDVQDGCLAGPSADFIDVYRRLMAAYSSAQAWVQSNQISADDKVALKSTLSRVESFRNELESSNKSNAPRTQNNGAPVSPGNAAAPLNPGASTGTQDDSSSSQGENTSPFIRFVRVGTFLSTTIRTCMGADVKCFFLFIRVGQASGGTLVKKSFFHPTYYYYSGGAAASFALINISTADVINSGTVTTTTSYMREKTFQKIFGTNRRYDAAADKEMDKKSNGDNEY